ncbi:MAG: cyclic nucleotide-binding domain-containing protein, partial [Chloroflexi bacterium]|nr:cyclic nucleotide-binding domain-containing protein [Chloroflexota bacterium]
MHSETGLLSSLPLLRALPDDVQRLVERSFVTVELSFGETVFGQGDAPDGYYVVVSGNARVLVEDETGREVSLNMLGPGDAFGEASLLEGTPRTASVRASSDLKLLRLDRGLFQGLLESYPEIEEEFNAAAKARKVNDFLRLHSAFAVLPRHATLGLIDALQEISLNDGEVAVRQGAPADAMFLVQEGRLGVWREDGSGTPRRVRTLHAGEFFGERALVERGARTATVRAEGPVLLRKLADEHFQRLLVDVPEFARRVQERIALYEARDRGIFSARVESTDTPVAAPEVWSPEAPGLAVTEYGGDGSETPAPPVIRAARRFPLVRQIDEMDCGAACLAIVARAFGQDVSITTIRQAAGTSTDGTSLSGLLRGGEEIGLNMRAIKSSPDRIATLPLPAIIHWKGNHWVVLHRVDGEHIRISDPARGLRRVPIAELAEHWSGYAALAQPTERLAQAPRGGVALGWLLPMLREHRRRLALAVVLALFAAVFEMALPVFTQVVIDQVIAKNSHTLLYELTAAMLGLLLLAVLVTVVQRLLLARVAVTLDTDTLDYITTKLLRLPMRYFESRRTADIQRRLTTLSQVRQVLIEQGVVSLSAATQVLVAFVLMLHYSLVLSAL